MSKAPEWKVYDSGKQYQAACKDVEAAASLMGFYGEGATIRWGHGLIVWTEGAEDQSAMESYDFVAETVQQRVYNRIAGWPPAGMAALDGPDKRDER